MIDAARVERDKARQRHKQDRRALLVGEYGAEQARRAQFGMSTINPRRQARDARTRAAATRAEADELRILPTGEAARRIEAKRVKQGQLTQTGTRRARQLDPFEHDRQRGEPRHEGPKRGL